MTTTVQYIILETEMCNFEMQPCQRVTWDIQHPSFIEYGLYSAMLRDSYA